MDDLGQISSTFCFHFLRLMIIMIGGRSDQISSTFCSHLLRLMTTQVLMIRPDFFHLLFLFLEIDNNDNWWKIRSYILHLLLSLLLDSFHASQPRSTSSGWVLAMLPLLLPIVSLPSQWKQNITIWLFFCIPATIILLSARFEAFSMPWKTLPLKKRKSIRAACSVFIHLLLPFWLRLFDFWSHILPLLLLIPRSRLSLEWGRKCRRKQDFSTLTFMLFFAIRILPCLH